ncbi:MAG: peptidoglycan DD-metalloendopeptidase family protein [Desulfobacterales bacterium]
MLRYPYMLYARHAGLGPLFRNLRGDPLLLDLSTGNHLLERIDVRDQKSFQSMLEGRLPAGANWGLGGYLERRDTLLRDCPQMVSEERYFHLGLDVMVPVGSALHAPLDAVVSQSGYEEGEGNYGGFILLKHAGDGFEPFYSFYGHLDPDSLPPSATRLAAGAEFARIGDFHQNGNWYHHTHLQIVTVGGLKKGYLHKGYCARKDLAEITDLCPDPVPFFKR